LRNRIDAWMFAGLERLTPRGLDAARLRQRAGTDPPLDGIACAEPAEALRTALAQSAPGDRVLAFGSFYVAAAALEYLALPG
jgi:dihydrofolate synthase/folylpolyglutamate synthase